ncbi:hypothetical protein EDB89DRAFT_1910844 [Lactarius sanguifluus]|nr:hypothetical protein EDB89DRAFT_1910844 [Lactarius sanguifluus]
MVGALLPLPIILDASSQGQALVQADDGSLWQAHLPLAPVRPDLPQGNPPLQAHLPPQAHLPWLLPPQAHLYPLQQAHVDWQAQAPWLLLRVRITCHRLVYVTVSISLGTASIVLGYNKHAVAAVAVTMVGMVFGTCNAIVTAE